MELNVLTETQYLLIMVNGCLCYVLVLFNNKNTQFLYADHHIFITHNYGENLFSTVQFTARNVNPGSARTATSQSWGLLKKGKIPNNIYSQISSFAVALFHVWWGVLICFYKTQIGKIWEHKRTTYVFIKDKKQH